MEGSSNSKAVRTARCAAAFADRCSVEECDLQEAWRLCLGHRQKDQSSAPKSPSSVPATRPPLFGNRSTETSSAPLGSRPDPKVLGLFQPCSHVQFLNWVCRSPADIATGWGPLTNPKAFVQPRGPIAWLETLMSSIRSGWLDNVGPMRLQHRMSLPRKNFWCFLDASRSAGMNQFLDAARNVLAGVPSRIKSGRFHLVVLAAGEIRWVTRNASATAFRNAIELLREASGKSLIIEGITRLHRGKLRRGSGLQDRLVILSDGLASPGPGENPAESLTRLQQILRRLTRTGTPCAWLHPTAKRGMRRWIPQLLRGLPFIRFEV